MNWKEFKDYVENEGVTDDMDIDQVEFCDVDVSGELEVRIFGGTIVTINESGW